MSRCNYVYVIRFGDIDHKVGFSVSPTRRIAEVKGQSVVRVWRRPNGDAQALEAIAHRLLREWRIPLPSEKERFSVSADVACEAIEIAARALKEWNYTLQSMGYLNSLDAAKGLLVKAAA